MLDKNDLCRTDYDREVFNSLPKPHWLDAAAGSKVLDPDPAFIAPSLFSHTLRANQDVRQILGSQELADRIIKHYFHSVHSVAPIVHRPSFQERYYVFWSNTSRGVNDTPESTQALIYAALFAGVVSMDAKTVREELGGDREEWVKTLEEATALSLSRANVIRTTKPETMQAFVMYLVRQWICLQVLIETCSEPQQRRSKAPPCDSADNWDRFQCVEISFPEPSQRLWHQLSILREAWDSTETVIVTATTPS